MFKILMLILLFAVFTPAVEAQYYYKDIVSNEESARQLEKYKIAKIKGISIKSFNNSGEPSPDFVCEKKFDKKYTNSELFTRSLTSPPSLMTTYYNSLGNLLSSTDSSVNSVSKILYEYEAPARLKKITSSSHSQDEDYVTGAQEQHIYFYGKDNLPDSMKKVTNKNDTVNILFARDENGNLSIEKNLKTGAIFYYYYDKTKRLTDIVLTGTDRPGLHPQYVFTYNGAGDLIQMITSGSVGANYSTWKYNYDDGLRTAEKLYGKDRKLAGSIEYTYKK